MSGNPSRGDLIDLVRRIAESRGTEAEINEWLDELRLGVADPKVTDYIFWPERSMTPEEIVDRALAYKPIALPPNGSGEPA